MPTTQSIPAPFMSSVLDIKPEWIDYNGHLNMAYYNVLFDTGVDEAYATLGFGPEYRETCNHTTYTAEFHIRYVRELHLTDKVKISLQMLDHNDKSFHLYQEIRHVDGWLAATGEALGLHIDMSGPKVARFPDDIAEKIEAMMQAHASLAWPNKAGKGIGIRHR